MIKGKLLLLAGVLSVLPMTDLSAQNQRVKSDQEDSYVIVTFVRSRKQVKMKTIYHWIMSADPKSDEIYPISFAPPIYLDSLNTPYAKGALMTIAYKDNMNKEKAYILQFLNYPKKQSIPLLPGNAGYDFNGYILPRDEEDLLSKPGFVSDLVQCTKQHMKKVQVIRKKWKYSSLGKNLEDTSRHQETIKVYLTPVKGQFSLVKLQLDPTQKDELEGLKNRMIRQGAKPLPISESDVNVRLYNNYYETIEGGLYIIETYPENSEDYSVLIYDENKQELIAQRIFI